MELTEQAIRERIAKVTAERDKFLEIANQELAARNGAINALTELVDGPAKDPAAEAPAESSAEAAA